MSVKMIARGVVSTNRKANYNYHITKEIEAGIQLQGAEVKSLRLGQCNISESYVCERNGELFINNSYIPEYQGGEIGKFDTRRERKLLLHRKQINELIGIIDQNGSAVIPMQIYFNDRGVAKVKIGVGTGKKQYDKRQAIADRDWERSKARVLKGDSE